MSRGLEEARAAHNAVSGQTTAQRIEAVLAEYRPRCPVHGIPDCSPLLNGCSRPSLMHQGASDLAATLASTLDEGLAGKVRELADHLDAIGEAVPTTREGDTYDDGLADGLCRATSKVRALLAGEADRG